MELLGWLLILGLLGALLWLLHKIDALTARTSHIHIIPAISNHQPITAVSGKLSSSQDIYIIM